MQYLQGCTREASCSGCRSLDAAKCVGVLLLESAGGAHVPAKHGGHLSACCFLHAATLLDLHCPSELLLHSSQLSIKLTMAN